jgi:hypothetical protein
VLPVGDLPDAKVLKIAERLAEAGLQEVADAGDPYADCVMTLREEAEMYLSFREFFAVLPQFLRKGGA